MAGLVPGITNFDAHPGGGSNQVAAALERDELKFDRRRCLRHCEERSDRSNPVLACDSGLLRGACDRARIRATRWLAMTIRGLKLKSSRSTQLQRIEHFLKVHRVPDARCDDFVE